MRRNELKIFENEKLKVRVIQASFVYTVNEDFKEKLQI